MNQKYFIVVLLALLCLASCKEEDNTIEEYADWQAKNEAYFEEAYAKHVNGGSASFVLKRLTLSDTITVAQAKHTDCILVDVLPGAAVSDGVSPIYTDTACVHYRGMLIPSPSYPSGYQFDCSYQGTFDAAVAEPTELPVNGVVEGFALALQHMHRGDYWRVTIPYQLGYGTTDSGTIPAYSTLIFEIRLDDFY